MTKNKVVGLVLLGLAFIMMVGTIIANQYLTFTINSLAVMTAIVCGIVLIFSSEEKK